MTDYDLIIIGTGPAGLTASIYASRYNLKNLVVGELFGGLAGEASEIHNYPSYEKISGVELAMKMINHAKSLGGELKIGEVSEVKKNPKGFEVIIGKDKHNAKKIIIATGTFRKKPGLDREDELRGKGVNYCATCDAGLYKDKIVGVVGGGNSALSSAILLSKFAKEVYLIYRKDKFTRAEPSWVKEMEKNKKIKTIFNTNITKLIGEKKLEEIELTTNGKKKNMKVDGVFFEIGTIPGTKLAEQLGIKMEEKYIEVNKEMKTNVPGVFAAGDVTNNPLKQIITACGEGAVAAHGVYEELNK